MDTRSKGNLTKLSKAFLLNYWFLVENDRYNIVNWFCYLTFWNLMLLHHNRLCFLWLQNFYLLSHSILLIEVILKNLIFYYLHMNYNSTEFFFFLNEFNVNWVYFEAFCMIKTTTPCTLHSKKVITIDFIFT